MIISPLEVWVQNVLPVVYDDSLSYMEVVAKINAKTNEIITQTNENTHAIETLASTIAELGDIDELRALLDEVEEIVENLYTTDVPLMDGTASAGSADHAARSDHVHPSDTSKAPLSHASNDTTYGIGDGNNYGHVKITDDINNTDTGTAVKASVVKTVNNKLSTFSKDNILDNWYFVGGGSQQGGGQFPINQRGLTIYTGTNYGIDRWKGDAVRTSVTLDSDGLHLTGGSEGTGILLQRVEKSALLPNRTYTLSVLFKGELRLNHNLGGTTERSSYFTHENFAVESFTVQVETLGNACEFWMTTPANTVSIIQAVKLELGSEQTLAHLENGVWVLNEIPDYGEELAKCQQYFLNLSAYERNGGSLQALVGQVYCYETGTAMIQIPTPVTMVKVPTSIVVNGSVVIIAATPKYKSVSNATPTAITKSTNHIYLTVPCDLAKGDIGYFQSTDGFTISADL